MTVAHLRLEGRDVLYDTPFFMQTYCKITKISVLYYIALISIKYICQIKYAMYHLKIFDIQACIINVLYDIGYKPCYIT